MAKVAQTHPNFSALLEKVKQVSGMESKMQLELD